MCSIFPTNSHFTRGIGDHLWRFPAPKFDRYRNLISLLVIIGAATGRLFLFDVLTRRQVCTCGQEPTWTINAESETLNEFEALGLTPTIVKTIEELGLTKPTPIQEQGIPLVLEGHDVMGLAQTGTGKTAAFGLPLIHKLMSEDTKRIPKSARTLILAPTRELVNQIAVNLRNYVRGTHLRVTVVIGGASIHVQRRNMERGTDILVATPGRLMDLIERNAVTLSKTRFMVLDEADQMLDLGFIHTLRKIAKLVATPRQTLMFSATMPKQINELSRAFQNDPVRVETAPPGKAADKITQSVHHVLSRSKTELLKDCLIERRDDLSLVFARTKHGAEKLKKHLVECGFKADSVHGNKSQGQRERAIRAFRNRDVHILVATDVAARGIDIPGVTHVYNFNLPEVAENYVHRIGRTARAGSEGQAIAFCAPEEIHMLKAIERLMGITIEIASGEEPVGVRPKAKSNRRGGGRHGQGPNRGLNGSPKKKKQRKHRGAAGSGENFGNPNRAAGGEAKADRSQNQTRASKNRRPRSVGNAAPSGNNSNKRKRFKNKLQTA